MAIVNPSNENPIPARFKVLEQLARGEDEVVVRARDTLLQREVVLKRPMPCGFGGAPDAAELARSLREARTLARVQHPGVVRLIDVIETRDGPMLVMEPVPGESLAERVARDGRPTPEAVRQLGISVCAALEVVHAAGIVHRGVSTSNLMMRDGASPVLTGFNFAKFGPGGSGTMPGTSFLYRPTRAEGAPPAVVLPPHPAPEQILGQLADARSDLFGLGWVMYELLTGEPPYSQEVDVERWTSPKDPRKLASETPRALADVVLKCLQTSPLKRLASASAVRTALEQCAPAAAASSGNVGAAHNKRRWKPIVIAAAGVAALLVAGGAYVAFDHEARGGEVLGRGEEESTRGIGVRTRGSLEAATPFSGKVYDDLWAVVIGINKYQQWNPLSYAVQDARSMKELLVSSFGFQADHILELIDEQATGANIRRMLGDDLRQRAKAGDGVIVFFAGHGQTAKLPSQGDMGYLVPVDGSVNESEYYSTLVPMSAVWEISNMIPAKHVFFAIDACYSGLAATSTRGMSEDSRLMVSQHAKLRSRQILTAGASGEPVIEKAAWGHSAFTYTLLEGLGKGLADSDGDEVITSTEIANYIKTSVPRISEHRQMPQFKILSSDSEADFIFMKPEAAKSEPADSAAPSDAPPR